jgi:hypothetical protein
VQLTKLPFAPMREREDASRGWGWGAVLAALVVALRGGASLSPLAPGVGHRDFLKPGVQCAAENDGSAPPALSSPPWREPRTDFSSFFTLLLIIFYK